jgi:hypothetical protein
MITPLNGIPVSSFVSIPHEPPMLAYDYDCVVSCSGHINQHQRLKIVG